MVEGCMQLILAYCWLIQTRSGFELGLLLQANPPPPPLSLSLHGRSTNYFQLFSPFLSPLILTVSTLLGCSLINCWEFGSESSHWQPRGCIHQQMCQCFCYCRNGPPLRICHSRESTAYLHKSCGQSFKWDESVSQWLGSIYEKGRVTGLQKRWHLWRCLGYWLGPPIMPTPRSCGASSSSTVMAHFHYLGQTNL